MPSLGEVFRYAHGNGTTRYFDIDVLAGFVTDPLVERHMVEIEPDYARKLMEDGSVDPERLRRMRRSDLTKPVFYCIVTGIFQPATAAPIALLVNGNHRYYYAFTLGRQAIDSYIFPIAVWTKCLLDPSDVVDLAQG